eukprot:CAMPEP_0198211906 /NCGR_PEP_ID=MMETSP1445-20131203/25413_1 /TAXON_ID=36898 /ORGANISM="Pyramimonas sp., Strain CCMP2087" /LENGTH=111 /DNA_ID=CAMNT_0043886263 /DNA_START=86 /DNA_END=418 /DNA_ORIENTATION=+
MSISNQPEPDSEPASGATRNPPAPPPPPPEEHACEGGEAMREVMSEDAIQGRVMDKIRTGFSAIEQMGFDGNDQFKLEWEEHKSRVEQFFKDNHPSDPGFEEARKALTGVW